MTPRKNLYFFHKQTQEMNDIVVPLKELAEEQGFHLVRSINDANIIVSVGGDNAFLQAIRKTGFRDDCLYIGVNTDSRGFYTDFTVDEGGRMIEAMKNEELEVRRYPVLQVTVNDDKPIYCLNECSIRSNIIKTFVIDVVIDDLHFETFRGDGLIVSTPTGSTAYNKSIHGAVIDPTLPSMQVSELASINNNQFRTLGSPFVLGKDRTLTLNIVQDGNDHPIIGADNEALSLRHAKHVHIKLSDKEIKVLKLKTNSFWHRVQKNFL